MQQSPRRRRLSKLWSNVVVDWTYIRPQLVACLLVLGKNGTVHKPMRLFGTTTRELVSPREWLLTEDCTHVGMESRGVYWKPV